MASEPSAPPVIADRDERASVRWNLRLDAERLAAFSWLIPGVIALVYVGVFVSQLGHNIWEFNWISDYASGFTVPEAVARSGTGGHTVLGPYGSYVSLWFGLLTARLPLHRQLWEIAPTLLFAASASIVGWAVARLATRRAGVLAALMVLIASPTALSVFTAPVAHNTTYPCVALLGAYLVWLGQMRRCRRAQTIATVVAVSVVLGTCLASDLLLLPTGVAPFSLAAAIAWLRGDRHARRLAHCALVTVAGAIPIAWLTATLMSSAGYRINSPAVALTPLWAMRKQANLLLEGLTRLFNGDFETTTPGISHAGLTVACEIVMALSLLVLLAVGARAAASFVLPGRRAVASRADPAQMVRALHIVYWVSSAVAACLAFLLSSFVGATHEAFYVTVLFSVAAVIPLYARSRLALRWLIVLGASLFFAASLVGLSDHAVWSAEPHPALARYEADVVELARRFGAPIGYTGYWDAASLTWSSDERVAAHPVFECRNPKGANLCIFSQETVPSWYAPAHHRSFLLVEAEEYYLSGLPKGLGRSLAAYRFGPMTMYIYPYDIASRLGPSTG